MSVRTALLVLMVLMVVQLISSVQGRRECSQSQCEDWCRLNYEKPDFNIFCQVGRCWLTIAKLNSTLNHTDGGR